MITGETVQLERKNGATWQNPNHLHFMMTTNHDHAVHAGSGNRRYVVYDVSEEHANDTTWFDPLYDDLDHGGYAEFLFFLNNLKLGNWHPRQIVRTDEAVEQQRMSGDSVAQWSQACIDADAIIGTTPGVPYDLGRGYPPTPSAKPTQDTVARTACTPRTSKPSAEPAPRCSALVSADEHQDLRSVLRAVSIAKPTSGVRGATTFPAIAHGWPSSMRGWGSTPRRQRPAVEGRPAHLSHLVGKE